MKPILAQTYNQIEKPCRTSTRGTCARFITIRTLASRHHPGYDRSDGGLFTLTEVMALRRPHRRVGESGQPLAAPIRNRRIGATTRSARIQ